MRPKSLFLLTVTLYRVSWVKYNGYLKQYKKKLCLKQRKDNNENK